MVTVKTPEELGKALKEKEEYIYIEGDLKNKIIRLKAAGRIAWFIAGGSIAAAVGLYLATPFFTAASSPVGGTGGVVSFTGSAVAAGAAVSILGLHVTWVAIAVAVAAGGYGAVSALKDKYKIIRKDKDGIMIKNTLNE